jgi:hypothetical protein
MGVSGTIPSRWHPSVAATACTGSAQRLDPVLETSRTLNGGSAVRDVSRLTRERMRGIDPPYSLGKLTDVTTALFRLPAPSQLDGRKSYCRSDCWWHLLTAVCGASSHFLVTGTSLVRPDRRSTTGRLSRRLASQRQADYSQLGIELVAVSDALLIADRRMAPPGCHRRPK